ncbi:MAG: hypothetical protein K6E47_08965 [Lachnospiraceae bacterium]|nr:hypothetical protein [Lachnospiraceae bacterium]
MELYSVKNYRWLKETTYDPMKLEPITGFLGMGMIPNVGAWKCSCGTENTGKFCVNCGNPREN